MDLFALMRQNIFESDREEYVTEFGRMVCIPEERMVGVATYCCCQARIRNVVESKVVWIFLDSIHQAENLHPQDMNALQELLIRKQLVDPIVCRVGGRAGECSSVRRRWKQPDVEEIGNDEMLCARLT